jgi:hypothetical protein
MKSITLFILLFIGFSATAQDQFRADFNYVTFFDPETQTWADWKEAPHTLVFNINENRDIKHYTAKGEVLIYRNMGNLEEDYTTSGKHYQIIEALDDQGNEIESIRSYEHMKSMGNYKNDLFDEISEKDQRDLPL